MSVPEIRTNVLIWGEEGVVTNAYEISLWTYMGSAVQLYAGEQSTWQGDNDHIGFPMAHLVEVHVKGSHVTRSKNRAFTVVK